METPPTTQGSGDHKTTPTVTMVISDKKRMFEDQQVGSGVPVVDHSNVTSKLSSKKFFGRKGDSINQGSFRSKRKQDSIEQPKVTVEALRETPPLRKKIALVSKRPRLRPLVHFDQQSIPIALGTFPAINKQFEQRNGKSVTGASAAHATVYEDLAMFRDHGDQISNELVLSCPYFRNEIGGEYQTSNSPETQFKRSIAEELRGVAASLVEQVVYEGPQLISRDELLMDLRNNGVQSPNLSEMLASDQASLDSFSYFEENRRPLEYVDYGALYYRIYFADKDHTNFIGVDEVYGPVAISLRRDKMEEDLPPTVGGPTIKHFYRIIIRTCQSQTIRASIPEEAIPASSKPSSAKGLPPKDIIEHVCPEFTLSSLRVAKNDKKVQDELMRLDEQELNNMYKIGLLYCKEGQSLEEEMYNNATASPELDEFLDFIGDRVRMKGFQGYRAQLDNRTDTTGEYSVYAEYNNCEIMFHVSTLLPYQNNHKQQLLRKRHIGNDIVTVIFQDPGAQPFCAKNIRSQFQHVFIVIKALNKVNDGQPVKYKVSVTRSYDVPMFGPAIPQDGIFEKTEDFRQFLLAKLINAENAGHHSKKFNTMATRTRRQYLIDLANTHCSSQSIEQVNVSRFDSILAKKKRKITNAPTQSMISVRGALAWTVAILLRNEKPVTMSEEPDTIIDCYLAISIDSLVLISEETKELLVHIPTSGVISWYNEGSRIMLFYCSGHVISLEVCPSAEDYTDDVSDQCRDIIKRLQYVNPTINEADFLSLFRGQGGRLGFTIERDGFVSDVLDYAAINGLQPGCRIVQVEKLFVASSNHDDILSILKSQTNPVRMLAIPTRRTTSHSSYRPYIMLREKIDWNVVWSLRPAGMDGGGRSRTSASQVQLPTELRRASEPTASITSSEVSSTTSSPHHKDHSSSTSKLKLPEKRLKSKRPYSYLAAMDSAIHDENYDKMQTILEPDDSRSYTSPTPSSEDIQEGTLTKGGGQEGSHFKKRKPMKTTSRGSMRKLMDNMMEHDQDDRQLTTPSPMNTEAIPRVTGSTKLSSRLLEPRYSTTGRSSDNDNKPFRPLSSHEDVFHQFTTVSEPTSPLRTSLQQPVNRLAQPTHYLSTTWEHGKVNKLTAQFQHYSSGSSSSSRTPRGSLSSEGPLKRAGSEEGATIGMTTSNSAPNDISIEMGKRPRSWEGIKSPTHQKSDQGNNTVIAGTRIQARKVPTSLHPDSSEDSSSEFVRKSHERTAVRRRKSEAQSSPPTPSGPAQSISVEQGYGLDDDNALSLKKMSVKDRTATWERRTSISQAAANAGYSYDTLKRMAASSRNSNRDSPARQIPTLQRSVRDRSNSTDSDLDQTDGHTSYKALKSPSATSTTTFHTYHSYTLPKASMSSSKPPLHGGPLSGGKLLTRGDRSLSSSESLAKHISEQLKLPTPTPTVSSSISEEPDEDEEYERDGKTRRSSAEARLSVNKSSSIPVSSRKRATTPEHTIDTTASGRPRSNSSIPLSLRRTPSPLVEKKTSDANTTPTKHLSVPRPSGGHNTLPPSGSGGHGTSQYRRASADATVSHIPQGGGGSKIPHRGSEPAVQPLSLAARRLQKASSLSNIDKDFSDVGKTPGGNISSIPRPSSSTTPSRLHPLVIKAPQLSLSGSPFTPLTIEELVSSPKPLPHHHHHRTKLSSQHSFPLKMSSSHNSSDKEMKVSSMTELEHVSKEMVAMTTTLTMQDVGGDNGEPGQVGGASDRPGSAHDGSETDSQPEYVPTDDEEDDGSDQLGSCDVPELVELQTEVAKLKVDLEKERDDKEELEEVVKLLQKENKILRQK